MMRLLDLNLRILDSSEAKDVYIISLSYDLLVVNQHDPVPIAGFQYCRWNVCDGQVLEFPS